MSFLLAGEARPGAEATSSPACHTATCPVRVTAFTGQRHGCAAPILSRVQPAEPPEPPDPGPAATAEAVLSHQPQRWRHPTLVVVLGSVGLALVLFAAAAVWLFHAGGTAPLAAGGAPTPRLSTTPGPSSTPSPPRPSPTSCAWLPSTLDSAYVRDVGTPPASGEHRSGQATMTIATNRGTIVVRMDAARTPCAIASFAYLAGRHYFDNKGCPRLVNATDVHILQCGDPTGTGRGGPGYRFADENLDAVPTHLQTPTPPPNQAPPILPPGLNTCPPSGLPLSPGVTTCIAWPSPTPLPTDPVAVPYYPRGMVAMANRGRDTNGSQFFFVTQYTTDIGGGSEPFGTVTSGMDILDTVAAGGDDGAFSDAGGGHPALKLVFRSVTVTWD
jgi:peptidyl-prolyl cis-trans isomerase B (cyclophilin B)